MPNVLLDKKRKYVRSLPCPKDGASLLYSCIKNEIRYVEGKKGKPEKVWNADLYFCEKCSSFILTDFGRISEWNKKNTPDLPTFIASTANWIVFVYSYEFTVNQDDGKLHAELSFERLQIPYSSLFGLHKLSVPS